MQLEAPALERLVVGLDDSARDAGVLAWATHEAAARHCSSQVLENHSTDVSDFIDEAAHAALLVVGSPLVAGSARRTSCPIVVVRGTPHDQIRQIVVGVDGSTASLTALEWAVDEAARHAAIVTVVHAWQQPTVDEHSLRGGDLRQADALCVADLAADLYEIGPGRLIQRRAVNGPAAEVLIAQSAGADLLVVGSRCSSWRTLQFGSVALATTQRADCPVVVVHPRPLRSRTRDPGQKVSAGGSSRHD